jgi:hypothetical protein
MKGAADITVPSGPGVSTLGPGAAVADHEGGEDGQAGVAADGMGQQGRLIVAAGNDLPPL